MRRLTVVVGLACLMTLGVAYGHHAAQGMVDEEVYAMIEALVEDTPHATIDINDLGGGMVDIYVEAPTVRAMENMIDDGMFSYLAMLDGQVTLSMSFLPRGGMAMEVDQVR